MMHWWDPIWRNWQCCWLQHGGEIRRKIHEGRETLTMTESKGGTDYLWVEGRSSLGFMLEVGHRVFSVIWGSLVRSFLQLSHPILKSAMLRLCSIKKNPATRIPHISQLMYLHSCTRNVLTRRDSHKSSDISGPPAEAVPWLSSASVLGANRCFD